jgi:hypothetical protein
MSETEICTSNNFSTLESSDSNVEKDKTCEYTKEINDECPGGVCSISNKRKMRPPGSSVDTSNILPQLDMLVSQLLGNVDEKTKDILKSSIENNSLSDLSDSDSNDEDNEHEFIDPRWDVIYKLVNSQLIIANAVSTLIKEHKSGD